MLHHGEDSRRLWCIGGENGPDTSTLPHYHTTKLPHYHTTILQHDHTSSLPHKQNTIKYNITSPRYKIQFNLYCISKYHDFSPAKIGFWPNSANLKCTILQKWQNGHSFIVIGSGFLLIFTSVAPDSLSDEKLCPRTLLWCMHAENWCPNKSLLCS